MGKQDQDPGWDNTISEEGQEERGEYVADRAWSRAAKAERRTTPGWSIRFELT